MSSKDIFRIVLRGAYGSGKTCFIQHISETDVIGGHLQKDVRINFILGRVTVDDNLALYVFAPPPQFYDVREYMEMELTPQRDGTILLLDVRKSVDTTIARDQLRHMRRTATPYLIALNRHDAADAYNEQEIRELFDLQPSEIVVKCNANARAEVRDTVLVLLALMSDDASARKLSAKLRNT